MPRSTVLVADDQTTKREIMTDILADAFAVTQTDNARDAVRLAERHRPDVVILDMVLPGMNGHIAHQITTRCPETAILVVSAPPTLVPSLDDGNFDAALAEPFDCAELVDVVRRLCRDEWTNADESIW